MHRMTARTPVQRQQSLAARKRAAGLTEVRSLWAPKEDHPKLRAFAVELARLRAAREKQK